MSERNFLINDIFWTFQGEGANAGRRALFIRLPKCNLTCSWCDTEFNSFSKISESALVKTFLEEPSKFAVITGGEPLMNKQIKPIIELLKTHGFEIAVETNGTFPLVEGINFITCSPKRQADFKVHESLIGFVNEYKYVVDKDFDFSILGWLAGQSARLSLSPEWNEKEENLKAIYEFIKLHPFWRISLQTHKIMGIK